MGLIIGVGNTKPTFPYDYYYGVKINTTVRDTVLERVGRSELHVSLPIQSMMRRCLLSDAGEVITYLHATDSTKMDTGATADLTGARGMVMVEIPEHYRKFEFDGTNLLALLSLYALPGFHKVRKQYISAYEAALDRNGYKLASIVNTEGKCRGGNNNSEWDGTYRSLLGMPVSNYSLTALRTYARNRGEAGLNGKGWNAQTYEAWTTLYWLYVVEYANRNCQATYTAELTSEGYHQGGLGAGVTTLDNTKWNNYNGRNPFIPCGTTNSLGNATGVVSFTMPDEYDTGVVHTLEVPSYRGVENPFGHIWKWTDGLHVQVQSDADGGKSLFFRATDDDPANFQDSNYNGYTERGEIARKDGYVKNILGGEYGDILPTEVGGDSSSYYADYFYTNIPTSGTSLRGVYVGGGANYGAIAGLASARTDYAPSTAGSTIGSRLCFIPA